MKGSQFAAGLPTSKADWHLGAAEEARVLPQHFLLNLFNPKEALGGYILQSDLHPGQPFLEVISILQEQQHLLASEETPGGRA